MLRLRQVVVAAADLQKTRDHIEATLGLPHVWADPGLAYFGLRNALYAIGDCFLEVVNPISAESAGQRFLDRAGHDAGYMTIVQTNEPLDDVRTRAAELDIRIAFEAVGDGVTGLHMHPADTGATLLSIDRCTDDSAWPWAGPAWDAAPDRGYGGITRAAFAVDDAETVSERWAHLLGAKADGARIELDGATLEFCTNTDGRNGLCEVDLAGPSCDPVDIAGVTFTTR